MTNIEKFNPKEWKRISTIKDKFRKKDGSLGVSRTYIEGLIKDGRLNLTAIEIDEITFYHISIEDQSKEDWGLSEKMNR